MRRLEVGVQGVPGGPALDDADGAGVRQFDAEAVVLTAFLLEGGVLHGENGVLQGLHGFGGGLDAGVDDDHGFPPLLMVGAA